MLKKWVAMILVVLAAYVPITFGQNNNENNIKQTEKIKSAIAKLGTGKEAKVKVILKDGTKLNGYVSEIKADSFVIINEKTGVARELLYEQAKQTKRNNSKKGLAIAGIVFGVAMVVIGIVASKSD
jgi:sRNA-binding regulator protein Hfq